MNETHPPIADDVVLRVENLRVAFETHDGRVDAVRGSDFSLHRGQTLALVGESGSGKSVTSYAILRLIQPPGRIIEGSIIYHPREGKPIDLAKLDDKDRRLFDIRGGKISMIFQEPMTALSPVHSIGNQVMEAILLHRQVSRREAKQIAVQMLGRVGIANPEQRLKQYPFEFSGGMRQRVVIAMALVCRPEILIADEPTTALDVTIQAQILQLIDELKQEMGTSVLFITHDLGVVAQIADEVVVMNQGLIMESAPVLELFDDPHHPYTRRLLAAMPRTEGLHITNETSSETEAEMAARLGIPPGFTIAPPDSDYHASVEPLLHPVRDSSRRLLVWPELQEVGI